MMLLSLLLSFAIVVVLFALYEAFSIVQIPPEEKGCEEDERQAIISSMSRQHLR